MEILCQKNMVMRRTCTSFWVKIFIKTYLWSKNSILFFQILWDVCCKIRTNLFRSCIKFLSVPKITLNISNPIQLKIYSFFVPENFIVLRENFLYRFKIMNKNSSGLSHVKVIEGLYYKNPSKTKVRVFGSNSYFCVFLKISFMTLFMC